MTYSGNFKARLIKLYQELSAHSAVQVIAFSSNPPVMPDEIEHCEQLIGGKLNDEFISFFQESNGYKLLYRIASTGKRIHGIYIPGLKQIFSEKTSIYDDDESGRFPIHYQEFGYRFRENLYAFDLISGCFTHDGVDYEDYEYVYYQPLEHRLKIATLGVDVFLESRPIEFNTYLELVLSLHGNAFRYLLNCSDAVSNSELIAIEPDDLKIIQPIENFLKMSEDEMQEYIRKLRVDLLISANEEDLRFFKEVSDKNDTIKTYIDTFQSSVINSYTWSRLGEKLHNKTLYQDAVYAYKRALDLDPYDYNAGINHGLMYERLSDYNTAINIYYSALEIHPKKDRLWYRLGMLHFLTNRPEKGYEHLERAIKLNPKSQDNYPMLAFYAIHFGDYKRAIPYCDLGIRYGNATNSYLNKALTQIIEGDREAAVNSFYYSWLAFKEKEYFWKDFDSDYDALSQYNIDKSDYMSLKSDIQNLIQKGMSSIQGYAARWSRGLNYTRELLDEETQDRLKKMGYPTDFIEWLYWGNHNYSVEVLMRNDPPNFTQEIFCSSDIEKHNANENNQVLLQNGFLIFASLSGAEYDVFDTNNNCCVYSIRANDYLEELPSIEEIYSQIEKGVAGKDFEINPSLKFEDENKTKLRLKSPYVLEYLYKKLFNGPRYDNFVNFLIAQI
jgi:tetratricopeptide (TPR) repeat protein